MPFVNNVAVEEPAVLDERWAINREGIIIPVAKIILQ